jgi:hypothetical protein
MVKISELKTSDEVRSNDMQDPEYRRENERTRLANDVATGDSPEAVLDGLRSGRSAISARRDGPVTVDGDETVRPE